MNQHLTQRPTFVAELEFTLFKEYIVQVLRQNYRGRNWRRDMLVFCLYFFKRYTAREIGERRHIAIKPSGVETVVGRMKGLLATSMV